MELGRDCPLEQYTLGNEFRDRDLKKIGRDGLSEKLIESAHEAIAKIDLSSASEFLEPQYGKRAAIQWLRDKFGVEITTEEAEPLEAPALIELAKQRSIESYDQRESEYPVISALYRFSERAQDGRS